MGYSSLLTIERYCRDWSYGTELTGGLTNVSAGYIKGIHVPDCNKLRAVRGRIEAITDSGCTKLDIGRGLGISEDGTNLEIFTSSMWCLAGGEVVFFCTGTFRLIDGHGPWKAAGRLGP